MSSNMTTQIANDSLNGLINPFVYEIFSTFNLIICSDLIGCFGIMGNVINILNFRNQGLHDSVSVTLTSLAVSDIGALLFQFLLNILVSPFWGRVNLPFSSSSTLLFFYPHGYFIRVSGYITSFAAFERCMCVVLPLKVKTIITRKVAIIVNCSIYIVLSLYLFPMYYARYLDLKYNPKTNRSVLSLIYRDHSDSVYQVTYFTNDLLLPYLSFLVLILCTAFLISSLRSTAKWRHSVTSANVSHSPNKMTIISSKEKKTSVMLTSVSVIFVVCLTPGCALLTAVGVVPELKAGGAYYDLTILILSFTSVLDTISCSVNTIVYYKMSSRYRETVHAWLPCLRKQT